MINLNHLNYCYRSGVNVLHDITAEIEPGIHLLMGENGAGKTTLLHIMAGLRYPRTATECTIDDVSTSLRLPSVLSKVFLLTDDMVFPYPTIAEMERYHAPFYPNFDAALLAENLSEFGINPRDSINNFSLGTRKKAYLAYALALRTDILLLDEPANGLDIDSKTVLLRMLSRNITDNQTVIISTHTIWDFQNLFDGVLVLSQGRLVLAEKVWTIVKSLAFVNSLEPISNALYLTQNMGRFQAIVPNDGTLDTAIDYVLLYTALHSPQQSIITQTVKNAR
ncbi:MAG: ABC transporter ATP-binding protein [Paramuribaculum sp.]|nr:ABC transporter ATP-binding protein [Paramuribaculum sp.]